MRIHDIHCATILDSRGSPTLEVQMQGEHVSVKASVPSGKSRGAHEATPQKPSVAIEHLEVLKPHLLEHGFESQEEFDNFLIARDGTPDKSKLGANLILALSLAFARLWAKEKKLPLWRHLRELFSIHGVPINIAHPRFVFNVVNGGAHVSPTEEWIMHNGKPKLDIQEFQVIPLIEDVGAALSIGKEFYDKLGRELQKQFGPKGIMLGDEAGYVVPIERDEDVLELLYELIRKYHYPMRIGLDVAASQLFARGRYSLDEKEYSSIQLREYYVRIMNRYNLISIEDPFEEEDFRSFGGLTQQLKGSDRLVVTDDLTTTNPKRLQSAFERAAGNAIIIKPNQIGSLSETLDVVAQAHGHGWRTIVSHRSGETLDDFIADLAVAVGAWGLKSGAPAKPERMTKYNRVVEIFNKK